MNKPAPKRANVAPIVVNSGTSSLFPHRSTWVMSVPATAPAHQFLSAFDETGEKRAHRQPGSETVRQAENLSSTGAGSAGGGSISEAAPAAAVSIAQSCATGSRNPRIA